MNDEILIYLTKPVSESDLSQLALFQMRFSELWSNWESLIDLGIELGGSFQNKGNGKVSGPGCGIEIHRLKGFYLDFRFFYADKELTQYYRIANKISSHCNDIRLRRCIKQGRKSWDESGCNPPIFNRVVK